MKKCTKIFSLLLALIMSLSVIGIYADDIFLGDEYIPEIEYTEQLDEGLSEEADSKDDLMPLAAESCPENNNYSCGYYFSDAAWNHLNGDRPVPVSVLADVISCNNSYPDPQGSSAFMYYATGTVNKIMYNFEVLYNSSTNTIWHYLYTRNAIGPLSKIN